jgi:hypothetical protein
MRAFFAGEVEGMKYLGVYFNFIFCFSILFFSFSLRSYDTDWMAGLEKLNGSPALHTDDFIKTFSQQIPRMKSEINKSKDIKLIYIENQTFQKQNMADCAQWKNKISMAYPQSPFEIKGENFFLKLPFCDEAIEEGEPLFKTLEFSIATISSSLNNNETMTVLRISRKILDSNILSLDYYFLNSLNQIIETRSQSITLSTKTSPESEFTINKEFFDKAGNLYSKTFKRAQNQIDNIYKFSSADGKIPNIILRESYLETPQIENLHIKSFVQLNYAESNDWDSYFQPITFTSFGSFYLYDDSYKSAAKNLDTLWMVFEDQNPICTEAQITRDEHSYFIVDANHQRYECLMGRL